MRKVIVIMISLIVSGIVFSQEGTSTNENKFGIRSVHLVGGPHYSKFIFKNSEGNKNEDMKFQLSNAFGANLVFEGNNHIFRPELIFRQAGAKMTLNQTPLNWKMNYLNLNLDYLYAIDLPGMFSFQPGIGFGVNYMLNGEQTIENIRYNIIDDNSMNRIELNASGMLNITAQITSSFSIGAEYRLGIGLNQIENDNSAQKTRNLYNGFLLNLGFSLK